MVDTDYWAKSTFHQANVFSDETFAVENRIWESFMCNISVSHDLNQSVFRNWTPSLFYRTNGCLNIDQNHHFTKAIHLETQVRPKALRKVLEI